MIVGVLRQGAEYKIEHAIWLAKQIDIVFLSDVKIPGVETIPLKYKWPGWWSKMELFNPEIPGGLFYIDLDTVVVGNVYELISKCCGKTTMLSDFYFPGRAASGVMYISEDDKEKVWGEFNKFPKMNMTKFKVLGDGGFINYCLPNVQRWDEVAPGDIISYKRDVLSPGSRYSDKFARGTGELPARAKIVCFHGRPRPWQVEEKWIPKLES